jgi:hypothetical protein
MPDEAACNQIEWVLLNCIISTPKVSLDAFPGYQGMFSPESSVSTDLSVVYVGLSDVGGAMPWNE